MLDVRIAEINFLAVAAAGLAVFALGAVWYTALFGKRWRELQGISDEKCKEMQARRPPPVFLGGMIACYLVLALAVAVLFRALSVDSLAEGVAAGLLLWVGPAAAIGMTGHLASDRHLGVYLIDTAFQLLLLVVMGAILGAWR